MSVAHAVCFHGPGRVNLIGEHTDYNDGLCLPFAIRRGVTVIAEPLPGGRIEALAADVGERDAFGLAEARAGAVSGWRAFARGVVGELGAAGHRLRGARLTIRGDLPRGAGLASSAALESALALALLALAGEEEPDRVALARVCARVEHHWVGAETGLLDQFAVLLSRERHALLLDCRDLTTSHVALDLHGWTLAIVDSGQRRVHSRSGYNDRRTECRAARAALGLESLRDADLSASRSLPHPLDRRVRHVVTENARVLATVRALRMGEWPAVAVLLDASHASLRDDYEVSTAAVERAAAGVRAAGAAGARLIGGGFGGSVLGLFAPGREPPPGAIRVVPGPPAGRR